MSPLPKRIRANEVKEHHKGYVHSITLCNRTHRGEGPHTTRGTSLSISSRKGDGGPPGRHLGGEKKESIGGRGQREEYIADSHREED